MKNLLQIISKKTLENSTSFTRLGKRYTITNPNINLNELMMVFIEDTVETVSPVEYSARDLNYLDSIKEMLSDHKQGITDTLTLDTKTIKKLDAFIDNDVSHPALNNIHITPDYIEATDGFRLLRVSQNTGALNGAYAKGSHLLPKDIAKIIAKQKDPVKIEFSSDFAQISVNDTIIFQGLYKGEYPDCNLIIPDFSKLDKNFPSTRVIKARRVDI